DHTLFVAWATKFNEELKRNNWGSLNQLPTVIGSEGFGNVSDTQLTFLGFDYFLPIHTQLFSQLEAFGCAIEITEQSFRYEQEPTFRHSFNNAQEEWNHIAAWALERVQHSHDIRVALICPDTQAIKDVAIEAFEDQLSIKDTLASELNLSAEKPYHLSLGVPLSATSIGKSALMHLSLLSRFEFQSLSDWLLSPLLGIGSDVEARAALAVSLRNRLPYELDLFTLVHSLNTKNERETELQSTLNDLLALKKQSTGTQSYRQWAVFFRDVLQLLAWPKVGLNSHEHQAFESWNGCVEQFAALDVVSSPIYLSEALSTIKQLCDQTIYQDQANPNVQVHIMGVLEAAELSFDAVWLAGFHENAWPPKPQVNPFIPLSIQKEKGIPDAAPEIFLQNAKDKIKQLLAMAPEVVVSHATNIEDITVGASPLVSHIELSESTIVPFDVYSAIGDSHGNLETLQDAVGIPFEAEQAKGGAGLIASQSACPFQAYAKYRLMADQEPDPEPGTDHRTHGTLVHEILHRFWEQVKTQRNLLTLIDADQLGEKLEPFIASVIAKRNRTSGLEQQFDSAQISRVKALLLEWLALEASRPAFTVSLHEQLIEYSLAGLGLRFIVDRVDELEGRVGNAVIDYKTGGNNTEKDWCGERPSSPQLPLYALAVSEQMGEVEALAYGQINAKNTALIGLAVETDLLPDMKPPELHGKGSNVFKDLQEWDEMLPLWKHRLEKLAVEFREGNALVNPTDKNIDCAHCEFTPFCRIKELSAVAVEDESAPA
ncbi:MAG: ATP-dependent helicase/nuclease subunit B, partial [Cryomorphaceae bacterium]